MMSTLREALAAPTKALASRLSTSLGSNLIRWSGGSSGGDQVVVHANIGKLLELPAAELDTRLENLLSSFAAEQSQQAPSQEGGAEESTATAAGGGAQQQEVSSPTPSSTSAVDIEAETQQGSGVGSTQARKLAQAYEYAADYAAGGAGGSAGTLGGSAPPVLISLSVSVTQPLLVVLQAMPWQPCQMPSNAEAHFQSYGP